MALHHARDAEPWAQVLSSSPHGDRRGAAIGPDLGAASRDACAASGIPGPVGARSAKSQFPAPFG